MNNQINKLQRLFHEHKLPHAIMLTGKHVDVVSESLAFANWLLCINKNGSVACGNCNTCKLMQADTSPDFIQFVPIKSGNTQSIKIEQARNLIQFVQIKPQYSSMKVIVLCGVEYLNTQTANALLKTLEEPPLAVHIILTATDPELLIDTIVSRCFIVNIDPIANEFSPNQELLRALLVDIYNTLIISKVDIVTTVDKWMRNEVTELLTSLWLIIAALVHGQYKLKCSYHGLDVAKASIISASQSLSHWWSIFDMIVEAKKNVLLGRQVNIQLFLENLMFSWKQNIHHGRR